MQPRPWPQFVEEVLALYAPPIRRIATYRKMRQALGEFGSICATTADLTPAAIARWIQSHPERRPETTASLLRNLAAACTYGMMTGAITSNPFAWRRATAWVDWDVPELDPPVHSAAEMARVLLLADAEAAAGSGQWAVKTGGRGENPPIDHAIPIPSHSPLSTADCPLSTWKALRLRALVYTLAYTGARKREVLGLAVADVDLVAGMITIRTNRRRGLKTRQSAAGLPIAAELATVLAGWIPICGSEWLFPGVTRKAPWLEGFPGYKALDEVKALGLRAGVPNLTPASCRHTFASLSEGWGIGETMLQRLLRHTSIRTQRAYRHPLPEGMREAAAKIHFE